MIRPPSRFRVLGQSQRMRVVDEVPTGFGSPELAGGTSFANSEAWIKSDMSFHQQMETYLHEALHTMIQLGGLEVYLGHQDEPFVNAFAPQLLHFLRDNPKVIEYLTQKVLAA